MIHILQCLCGPERHAIFGILYNDEDISADNARVGLEAMIEEAIERGDINRRCEICDKPIKKFIYEDGISKEQDWNKAKCHVEASEQAQIATQIAVKALRKADKN